MNYIWGFGDFVIHNDSIYVTFTNCVQKMYYERINIANKNIYGSLYRTLPKYRPHFLITINLLTNEDVWKFQDLLAILNSYLTDGMTIIVNYSTNNTDNILHVVILDLFDVLDISTAVGQRVILKFYGKYVVSYMKSTIYALD